MGLEMPTIQPWQLTTKDSISSRTAVGTMPNQRITRSPRRDSYSPRRQPSAFEERFSDRDRYRDRERDRALGREVRRSPSPLPRRPTYSVRCRLSRSPSTPRRSPERDYQDGYLRHRREGSPRYSPRRRSPTPDAVRVRRSPTPEAPRIIPAQAEVASRGQVHASYKVPGLISVPSDGIEHNVTIAKLLPEAELSWLCMPSVDSRVHMTVSASFDFSSRIYF